MCTTASTVTDTYAGVIYTLHAGDHVVRYVGQTVKNPLHRLSSHKNSAKNGSKLPSHTWMRKHGVDSIQMCIIETFDQESLHLMDEREMFHIAHYRSVSDNLTNLSDGGSVNRGFVVSEETRKKLSEASKGRKYGPMSQAQKDMISRRHKGKTISAEQREKQSEMMKGNSFAKGNKVDREIVERLAKARVGNKHNNPQKANHVRWHVSRGISKPETCIHCKAEADAIE